MCATLVLISAMHVAIVVEWAIGQARTQPGLAAAGFVMLAVLAPAALAKARPDTARAMDAIPTVTARVLVMLMRK
jgi:hypothetical protein